jgi:hypothetical protein
VDHDDPDRAELNILVIADRVVVVKPHAGR